MIGLLLLLPIFFHSTSNGEMINHDCRMHSDGWCEPNPGEEKNCGFRRVWNQICAPICGAADWGSASNLSDRQHECMYLCGGNTATPYELEVSLSIWRVGLSPNCTSEMKAGWKPPSWLLIKAKAMLMYVSEEN